MPTMHLDLSSNSAGPMILDYQKENLMSVKCKKPPVSFKLKKRIV